MSDTLFGDVVTLYNHYDGKWYRTVLTGVQWTEKTTKTVDSDGKMHVNPEIGLTVPYRAGYVLKKEYVGRGFTFGLDNLDVVVLGCCEAEITDDYTITDLKRDYESAATIYTVSDNTLRPLLKHWSVSAKCK